MSARADPRGGAISNDRPYRDLKTQRDATTAFESDLIILAMPEFGDRVAMKIEPLEIQTWIDGLSKGIRSKVRNLMSAIYRHGQIFGKIPRREECNPMRWVSASSSSDDEAVVITPEQAWAIAANLALYERTLVITNAATACRISECLGFKWSGHRMGEKPNPCPPRLDAR